MVSRNGKFNSTSKGDSFTEKYTTKINNKYAVLGSANDKSDGLQRDHGPHSAGLNGGFDVGLRPTFVQGEPSGSKNIAGPKHLITTKKFHKKKRTRKEELVFIATKGGRASQGKKSSEGSLYGQ